jgi:hypothetical protein
MQEAKYLYGPHKIEYYMNFTFYFHSFLLVMSMNVNVMTNGDEGEVK